VELCANSLLLSQLSTMAERYGVETLASIGHRVFPDQRLWRKSRITFN
jgi:hypothetical protein